MTIERLTFIYDADGTIAGEVRYWFGSLVGATHCSLCDITHNKIKKRSAFVDCAERLALPIEYLHRDGLTANLAKLTAGKLPCVVGHEPEGDKILLQRAELEALKGDIARFETQLRVALEHS